ncbi:type IV pilus assembly protein PilE [Desulfonatronum zhilinae]|nr:type IV pilus assembly protein PilE [Desulfonatronum zhilinae]
MQNKSLHGFTIIELLVVVAILAILAAIAIPQYTKYVTNARRADGKTALVEAAQRMERHFTNNHTFGVIDSGNYTGATIPAESESGYYALEVTVANATAFTIQATAQGKQAGDTLCANMTINHLGQRGAKNDQNSDTTGDCW